MFTVELKNQETNCVLDVRMSEFKTGQDCAIYAGELNAVYVNDKSPVRARVIPIKAEIEIDWRQRERHKLAIGDYKPLPWFDQIWFVDHPIHRDHIAHMSIEKPGKIAYTQTPEKGISDTQTPINPGRYLTKFYSDVLSESAIRTYATSMSVDSAETEIELIYGSDEIGEAYKTGPSSCMGGKDDNFFSCKTQPAKVYGAGDLALAIIRDGDGRIMSRCVSWPSKSIYASVYGDDCAWDKKLRDGLNVMGINPYSTYGDFNGAKLLRIESHSGSYVMPYLDIGSNVSESDCGEFFIIDSCGNICAENVNGLSGDSIVCQACDSTCPEDEYTYIEGYGIACYECSSYCESCEEYCLSENMNSVDNGHKYVCDSCLSDYPGCDGCGERFHLDNIICTADGETYCETCIDNDHALCEDCSEYHADTISADDKQICVSCFDSGDYFKCKDCDESFSCDDSHDYHSDRCESCGDEKLDSEPVLDLMLQARAESNLAQVRAFLKGYYLHVVAYGATR